MDYELNKQFFKNIKEYYKQNNFFIQIDKDFIKIDNKLSIELFDNKNYCIIVVYYKDELYPINNRFKKSKLINFLLSYE